MANAAVVSVVNVVAEKPRLVFVDLLRLLASLQMIQGHTIDALLVDDARVGSLFARWTWIRGLTAVSFMFASGVALYISGVADVERYRSNPKARRKRLVRAGQLLAIGYTLHFPMEWVLRWFGSASDSSANASLVAFAAVDVLQCNGLCLLVLHGLSVSGLSKRGLVFACAAISAVTIFGAPFFWRIEPTLPGSFLLNYLTSGAGSLFPLFPWSGFVLGGVAISAFALPRGLGTARSTAIARVMIVACSLLVVGKTAEIVCAHWHLHPTANAYSAWPPFSLVRLGAVVFVCASLAVMTLRVQRLPQAFTVLAGESLFMYVAHLLVLFSAGIGIGRIYRHALSLPVAIAIAMLLIVATFVAAYAWAIYRGRGPKKVGAVS